MSILLWQRGAENPQLPAFMDSDDSSRIVLKCISCHQAQAFQVSQIDERLGGLFKCVACTQRFYIPGIPRRKFVIDIQATAGVRVPINEFNDWYTHHPVYERLGSESWLLNEHGLWGFCAGCSRQYTTTVLTSFVNYQTMMKIGAKGFVFGANNPASAKDMNALQSGACPDCSHSELVAIMRDIPSNIQDPKRKGAGLEISVS